MARLFVGNLSFDVTPVDLRAAFATYGQVTSADVVMDASSGGSRGFGFIEMLRQAHAEAAVRGLDGTVLKGRTINVSPARARSESSRGRASAPRGWAVVGDRAHRW
jgi:RNA recognition motif-containing protein